MIKMEKELDLDLVVAFEDFEKSKKELCELKILQNIREELFKEFAK